MNSINVLIHKYLSTLPEKVQLSVVCLYNGKTDFIGAERTKKGIRWLDNRAAGFEIGSITKVFTATLFAYALEDGLFEADDPVQDFLAFTLRQPVMDGEPIRLRHLANHTSGMRHQPPMIVFSSILRGHPRRPFYNYNHRRYENYLKHAMKLSFTPGTSYHYSNMGMGLLGKAISNVFEQTYEQLVQAKLFQPLGMDNSSSENAVVKDIMVPGWSRRGVVAPNWDMYALASAGGIKTCAVDFAKFIQWQMNPTSIVLRTQQPTFTISERYSVGLGWHILNRTNGERWLTHGGGMLGYTANVNVNVEKRYGTIVLSNFGNAENWQQRSFELSRDLLDVLEQSNGSPDLETI
jgi:CubicO group peptidase (beta-lactamase class C family)